MTANRRPRRLLTVAHSYCVALNRRLAHEMARASSGTWAVTAVAPSRFHGDLRMIVTETADGEPCDVRCVRARLSQRAHVMFYGRALRAILHEGWDLIHCWEEPFVIAGAQTAHWAPAATPLVFTTYQNLNKRYPPPFTAIERYAVRRAAGWIAGGALVEEALKDRVGYRDKPRAVIPMGVDVTHFHPAPQLGAALRHSIEWHDTDPPVVGFLGRFVEEKGVRLLTQALDTIGHGWRALFVGGGPLETSLRSWADRHPGRVRVVTGVPHHEVRDWLNAMDLLCVPSQTVPTWREQFGRAIVEAFACGVPVLGSDSGEIPRVIADAGIVIGERDERGWVEQISRLLTDPHARAQLSAAGQRRAATYYAWSVVARRHLEFFDSLTNRIGTQSSPAHGAGSPPE